jgi:glycosyltransferase involved in cell wall biosynthesis
MADHVKRESGDVAIVRKGRVPLSVVIPVKNEAANIRACLESVRWASEVFVVDSGSQDETVDTAREYTDLVVQFSYGKKWPKKKNWALENLPFGHDWVLFVDADERVTGALREAIAAAIEGPGEYDGFYINRRVIFLGQWIRHCGWYPSWNLRLFKHRAGRFERVEIDAPEVDVEVHEHVVLRGKAGYLEGDLLHEDKKSIYDFIARQNRFTSWDATMYYEMMHGFGGDLGIRPSLFGDPVQRKRFMKRLWARLPLRPVLRFLWMYGVRLGFLDGYPGLLFCLLFSSYEVMVAAKTYEMRIRDTASIGGES